MVDLDSNISIIKLSIIKTTQLKNRDWQTGWINHQDPTICCLQETCFKFKDINRLKAEG